MAKPLVVAQNSSPNWLVTYVDDTTGEECTLALFGPATIRLAVDEAETKLDETRKDWYTIMAVEMINPDDVIEANVDTQERD